MKQTYKAFLLLIICVNTILICINLSMVLTNPDHEDESPITGLLLSSYIQQGQIKNAQQLAKVHHPKFFSVESYSGYLTVNEQTNSHMFFWYFPAEQATLTTPLILYLNGGPGLSALFGLFVEVGPFKPISPTELKLREHSWHKQYNVLFIDNPLGVGFGVTDTYRTNQEDIGRDLLIALKQFLKLFPELGKRYLYIAGLSYSTKFVVALGHTIHLDKQNPKQRLNINLKGIMIGSSVLDLINQINYSEFLYELGLLSLQEADVMKDLESKCIEFINNKKYIDAVQAWSDIIWEDYELTPHGSMYRNFTGYSNVHNYLVLDNTDPTERYMVEFMNQKDVQRAVHVFEKQFVAKERKPAVALQSDIMQSVAPWLSELLWHYKVLYFSGQLDVISGYVGAHNFIINLSYAKDIDFGKQSRVKWHVGGEVAGYCRESGNLTEVMVRNAGHIVPKDQPVWSLDMIDRFINNRTFH